MQSSTSPSNAKDWGGRTLGYGNTNKPRYPTEFSPRSTNQGSEASVKAYVEKLRDNLLAAQNELKDYKKQIETYRAEIELMRHKLETLNSDNMAHLMPRLQLMSESYNSAIAAQRKENLLLQQRLTDLKKDKSQMQQQIDNYARHLTHMESNIGM